MLLGTVVGSVWATRKDPGLAGHRMVLVQGLTSERRPTGRPFAALDTADAGPGDVVLVATSSEAAVPFAPARVPTDATVVGVVERVDRG